MSDTEAHQSDGPSRLTLTAEHGMLLQIRETLYEGNWDDFVADLHARVNARPYVFDTIPPSECIKESIRRHLGLIEEMRNWEMQNGTTLRASEAPSL